MGRGPSRNSWTSRFEIATTYAELLGVKKVCGIDFMVRSQIGCQVPCLRTRFGGPIKSFFELFVLPRLMPHNVYDTSGTRAVKSWLPRSEGIFKTSYPQTGSAEWYPCGDFAGVKRARNI
jgi:hypothetical protein